MHDGPSRTPRPVTSLVVGAVVAALEGVALVLYSLYIVIQLIRLGITGPADVSNPVSVGLEIAIFAVFGAAMLLGAYGLWRVRGWGRSLLVLGQLLALVVGVPLATAEGGWDRFAGIAIVLAAITGLVAAFWPTTTRAIADS